MIHCTCCSLNTSSTIAWQHAIRVSVQQTGAQSTAEAITAKATPASGDMALRAFRHKSTRKAASSRQLLLVLGLKENVCCFNKHVTVNIGNCVRRARLYMSAASEHFGVGHLPSYCPMTLAKAPLVGFPPSTKRTTALSMSAHQ